MANKMITDNEVAGMNKRDYSTRQWKKPQQRGAKFAADKKAKAHTAGPKMGQPLSDFESGIRSGYFMAQSDNAGMYRYKAAMQAGLTKDEARIVAASKNKLENDIAFFKSRR